MKKEKPKPEENEEEDPFELLKDIGKMVKQFNVPKNEKDRDQRDNGLRG